MKGKVEFKQPELIDGKEVTELEYDFSSLKGRDIQSIKKEMAANKTVVALIETDTDFHTYLFAKAAGVAVEDIYNLNADSYLECVGTARNFIIT